VLQQAAGGGGRLALVEGPAGIGKSRLLAELRRAAQLELAEQSGAHALAENVRSELYATGARPRTTALDGVESLTERELRVARLAAEGQTVTPKTVEVHLSNSYRKLGIASRRELPAALTSP
jgi:DNA-binding NarL/FixJ family response regulator